MERQTGEWSPAAGKSAWSHHGTARDKLSRFASGQVFSRLVEYSQYSSVHGLRYIGDQSLHPLERIFWVIAFILAVGSSSYFISNLFIKFDVMPVIMSLSPQSSSLKDFPFPAITICNMNHMRRSEAQRILNITPGEADLEQKLVYDFCESTGPKEENRNLSANWEYLKKFMVRVTQPCHELLVLCQWHSDLMNCNDLFNPSLTDEGMCCVFNRVNRDLIFQNPKDLSDLNVTYPFESFDWSPERGYLADTPPDVLPRRARGPGTHLGLTILVDAELHEYFCSSENGKGFKIMLNNPIETPKVSAFGISVAPGQETKVVVEPRLMTATPQLEGVDISKRQCYFEEERQLAFYRTYTQNSCTEECEANFTLAFCGCVLYHMPKSKDTRICGRNDQVCAHEAQRKMEMSMSMNEAVMNFTDGRTKRRLNACRCLPGCFEVTYGFAISAAPITDALLIKPPLRPDREYRYFKDNMAIIHVFFMESQFSGTVRGVLFGFTEFLSNSGGLLGLFLGFSFMSLVEMVYFLTLRVWFHLQKYRTDPKKTNGSGSSLAGLFSKAQSRESVIFGRGSYKNQQGAFPFSQ